MNRILRSNLSEFATQYSFTTISESDQYEYFSGFCVLSDYMGQSTLTKSHLQNINTGSGNDWGIDNFIIIVNDCLIESVTDIDRFISQHQRLKVKIILVQAKVSTSIDTGEFGKFLKGSRDVMKFINDNGDKLPPANERLKEKLEILDKIYSNANMFEREGEWDKPRLHLYYVTGGKTTDVDYIESAIADNTDSLEKYNLVCDIQSKVLGATQMCDLYLSTKDRLIRKITIENELKMPKVDKIVESHLCLVPFREFRKLIIDSKGKLIKSIFEDNVRDFQGSDNTVNQAIESTIKGGKIKLFTAMNNGLTIIAREVSYVGTTMTLMDYQIVNGCQTCHVLYSNRDVPGIDDLVLMVKIISSTDRNIRDSIVVANNSQTEVKREQLTSLLGVQRGIEQYYRVQDKFTKLYYERRSKQYRYGRERIPADHVITIPYQIMAFVSMVLGQPHVTSHYYGDIIKLFEGSTDGRKIFDKDSNPAFYYMSALASFHRDRLLESGKIDSDLRHVKHHLLYALSLVITTTAMPNLNSNSAEKYCEEVCTILCDEHKRVEAFHNAGQLIIDTLGRAPQHNDLNDQTLASRIKERFERQRRGNPVASAVPAASTPAASTPAASTPQEADSSAKPSKKRISKNINAEVSDTYKTDVPKLERPKVVGKIDLSRLADSSRSRLRKKSRTR